MSYKLLTPSSSNKLSKAEFTGANTVNGAGADPAGILNNPTND